MLNIVASFFFVSQFLHRKMMFYNEKHESKEVKHANEHKRSANEIIL